MPDHLTTASFRRLLVSADLLTVGLSRATARLADVDALSPRSAPVPLPASSHTLG